MYLRSLYYTLYKKDKTQSYSTADLKYLMKAKHQSDKNKLPNSTFL